MKKLYVLIVVAMLAALVLPMAASAEFGNDPFYLAGKVYDKTNGIGIGGAMVELYYERSTWAADDPCDRWDTWDPDRLQREWILVDTGVTNDKGFYMVDTLAEHHGRYKVIFTAPENALLPDGQSVVYTADGTYTWNLDVPNYREVLALPEDAALAANQAMYTFALNKGTEIWEPWDNEDPDEAALMGDLIINYVADVALTEVDCECDFYDEMYVFGTVYDSDLAGNPAYPDSVKDGIANVTVTSSVPMSRLTPFWVGPARCIVAVATGMRTTFRIWLWFGNRSISARRVSSASLYTPMIPIQSSTRALPTSMAATLSLILARGRAAAARTSPWIRISTCSAS